MPKVAVLLAIITMVGFANLAKAQEAFIQPWEASDQRLLAGLAVVTKQNSASSQQTQEMLKGSNQASQSVINQQWQNLETAKIEERTGYTTGNGISACSVSQGRMSYSAGDAAQKAVMAAVTESDNNWLANGGDGVERMSASYAMRKGFFCSKEENFAGICNRESNAGAYEAGDSNAGVWMLRRNLGGEEVAVGAMFIDVIAALPTVDPSSNNAEQDLALLKARRKGAILTGARFTIMNVIVSGIGGNAQ